MRKASLLLLAAMVITLVACNNAPKASEKEQIEKEKAALELERAALEKEKAALEKEKADKKAENEQTPSKPTVYSIADDGFLNIREMPNASAKIVGRLITGGDGAEYLGSASNWINVRYKGVEGFVNGKYAKISGLEDASMQVAGAKETPPSEDSRNTAMEPQNQGPREVCVEMDVVITNESDIGSGNLVLKECSDDVHLNPELGTIFKNVYVPQGKRWRFKRVEGQVLEGPGLYYPTISYAGKEYRTSKGNDGGIPDFTSGTKIHISMGFGLTYFRAYQTHKSRCRIYFTEANDELAY